MTRVYAKRDVHCPFSVTTEMIKHLHNTGMGHHVGPFPSLRAHVDCEITEIRDLTDGTRIHEALTFRWRAHSWIPLPVMSGLITVRPNGLATELRMEGTYAPPLGVLGQLFDRVIGYRLAQRTVNRFLDELRNFIEQEWQKEHHAITA